MDDELREMVIANGDERGHQEEGARKGDACHDGDDAIMKVLFGLTTLEEALNVVQEE